jgi:hypothetical protein
MQDAVLAWGLFRDPVASIRIELEDGTMVEPTLYDPPAGYSELGTVYVVEFEGRSATILGLDASGQVVESHPTR